MRKALLILGLISLLYGSFNGWRTIQFIKTATKVDATVLGFSSVHKLEKVDGPCSAYTKGCTAKVSYTMPSGEVIETEVPQPLFSRSPATHLTLFVDPATPKAPQIASVHALFRNSSSIMFVGIICIFLSWILAPRKLAR